MKDNLKDTLETVLSVKVGSQNILKMLAPLILFAASALFTITCPFTKVEESFNLQAIHDILQFGVSQPSLYDHIQFPGVVPRTFIGALLVSGPSWLLKTILGLTYGIYVQILVRLVLGAYVCGSLWWFASQVEIKWGKGAARWFAVLQSVQFHLMYYSSRPLPNILALPFGKRDYNCLVYNLSYNNNSIDCSWCLY